MRRKEQHRVLSALGIGVPEDESFRKKRGEGGAHLPGRRGCAQVGQSCWVQSGCGVEMGRTGGTLYVMPTQGFTLMQGAGGGFQAETFHPFCVVQ